jgi:virginiamycin B lyase
VTSIQEYTVADAAAGPYALTWGPDGAVWFVEITAGQIGRITPDGTVVEFALPDRGARPHAITAGAEGDLWVALESGALARVAAGAPGRAGEVLGRAPEVGRGRWAGPALPSSA